MNYRETLYKNALNHLRWIYEESKYNPDMDIYRSFDILQSVSDNQFTTKEWLVEKLVPFLQEKELYSIAVLGSWYGLTSLLLREKIGPDVHINNVDSDPLSHQFGRGLLKGTHDEKTHFITQNAEDWMLENIRNMDVIINTSTEHMEADDVKLITQLKKPKDIICFQGNNYHSPQSHINTYDSLDEFEESLCLTKTYYKGSLPGPDADNYDRYMVIGI